MFAKAADDVTVRICGVDMAKKKKSGNRSAEWAEAKRRCRLSEEEVRIAKELGFSPQSLIKNIPSASPPWKASVRNWLHGLYEKRMRAAKKRSRQENADTRQEGLAEPEESRDAYEECFEGGDDAFDFPSKPTDRDVRQANQSMRLQQRRRDAAYSRWKLCRRT